MALCISGLLSCPFQVPGLCTFWEDWFSRQPNKSMLVLGRGSAYMAVKATGELYVGQ